MGNSSLWAQEVHFGGSLRGYQFLELEKSVDIKAKSNAGIVHSERFDTELWLLRFTLATTFNQHIQLEIHPLLQFVSPVLINSLPMSADMESTYLPLNRTLAHGDEWELVGSIDHFNFKFNFESIRVVVGRQPITWGVTYFWPALDLFAPFSPNRIDRDYKPGVDVIRATIPWGNYSELELIGGALGSSLKQDGVFGALARIYLGPLDIGFVGGKFHGDTVTGGFLTTDFYGTGLRGELNWTQSGDIADRLRDKKTFLRSAVGIDRQLSPSLSLSVEIAFNGYGVKEAQEYLTQTSANRIARGEVTAMGKWYSGILSSWALHPLGTLNNSILVNWQDPSALWIPNLSWSTGNNSTVLLGAQIGVGSKSLSEGVLRSEYGSVLNTVFFAFQQYF
ncbi:MAG: hypothetical protein VYA53_02850 [Acidobacteriota bacterium]|nr:hypothetical protein [Acidobacteriota bacterium]